VHLDRRGVRDADGGLLMRRPGLRLPTRRRAAGGATITGLDIQPGEIVAAEVTGGMTVMRAASAPLDPALMRDGEVADADALAGELKAMFGRHGLPPRVRVGLASPRAVMRTLELPPLPPRDVPAAIRLQAAEHFPMPLADAVVDHRVLDRLVTDSGPRLRVVVVASAREPVERLLGALRRAGLRPEGVDLAAFALVRALYAPGAGEAQAVLYAHVAGMTTLAIARGARCDLARSARTGLEALSSRLAEREGVPQAAAHSRLVRFGQDGDLTGDAAALAVLDHGLADLADEIRNTMEFHAGRPEGAPVSEVVLTGPGATIPNFAEVLEQRIGTPVRTAAPAADAAGLAGVAPAQTTLAAGLALEERSA